MSRRLIEGCDRLNIYDLLRQNKHLSKETLLAPFTYPSATLTVKSAYSKAERTITVSLFFTTKPGTFGGLRLYLECPQCFRAVTDYYLPSINSEFLCRHCHNLAYSCQSRHRDDWWEMFHKYDHKQKKIQRKLRNKWLRRPTKERLVLQFNALGHIGMKAVTELLGKRLKRVNQQK